MCVLEDPSPILAGAIDQLELSQIGLQGAWFMGNGY